MQTIRNLTKKIEKALQEKPLSTDEQETIEKLTQLRYNEWRIAPETFGGHIIYVAKPIETLYAIGGRPRNMLIPESNFLMGIKNGNTILHIAKHPDVKNLFNQIHANTYINYCNDEAKKEICYSFFL